MSRVDIVLLLAFACNVARADIDLTPIASVRDLEGCKFPQLEFRDGSSKITYEVPKGWRYMSRDRHTLVLNPTDKAVVSARIQFMPNPAPLVLDERQLQRLKETAPSLVPPDSKLIGEPNVTANPLEINGRPTCEIDVLFVLHSERLHLSVLFVDLGESHLRFTLVTRASDFPDLHKAFQQSWYSWQWVGATAPREPFASP
jgi:hypothetical protein